MNNMLYPTFPQPNKTLPPCRSAAATTERFGLVRQSVPKTDTVVHIGMRPKNRLLVYCDPLDNAKHEPFTIFARRQPLPNHDVISKPLNSIL